MIILDTDFRGDCDDAGALATLHALASEGACEILGVMASTTGPHVVAAIDAVNTFYGRPEIPIGLNPGTETPPGDSYAPYLAVPERFPSTKTNAAVPDSTTLYRQLLHDAPDHSVTIVVVGSQSCVALLLESEAGGEGGSVSDLSGHDLVAKKVRELVVMGGHFTDPEFREYNITLNVPAAQAVASRWPTRVTYSGFEIGRVIMTGAGLSRFDPEQHPVAMAYKQYTGTEGGAGVIGNRNSWDQTAALYAVKGAGEGEDRLWNIEGPVRVSFDDDGRTRFEPDDTAGRYFLAEHAPVETVARTIESYMLRAPGTAQE